MINEPILFDEIYRNCSIGVEREGYSHGSGCLCPYLGPNGIDAFLVACEDAFEKGVLAG